MPHLFLSLDGRCRDSWRAAFPDLQTGQLDDFSSSDAALIWCLFPAASEVEALVGQLRARLAGRPLVVLADEPSEDAALAALTAGASGYCNGHAAAPVLQQVASAVEHGGVWVGQGLMQRLLTATARLPGDGEGAERRRISSSALGRLSAREQEAAALLGKGLSNKEIARQLDITERTVKAHVGSMLEEFGARDRLQLSLIINGIEEPRRKV